MGLKQRAETISKLDGILSVSLHVGNSDIVAEFVYDNSECLVDVISEIKHMQDIEKVLWSEEIYKVPVSKENILKSLKKYWTIIIKIITVDRKEIKFYLNITKNYKFSIQTYENIYYLYSLVIIQSLSNFSFD